MKETLLKEIEVEKEVLSTLPKNNKKNIDKYVKTVGEELQKYQVRLETIKKEMLSRKEKIIGKLSKEEQKKDSSQIDRIINEYHWFNNYNTSFEKMEFDKILYKMSKDKTTYEGINKTIYDLIGKYKEAGIELKQSDFSYSPIFYQYMKVFLENVNDLENIKLKDAFEKLYWKESSIITHIELTFKSLYYKYKDYFDKYCYVKQQRLLKEFNNNLIEQYQTLKRYKDKEKLNISNIYNRFNNKELNPNDFSKENIDKVISNYIDISKVTEENMDSVVLEFTKLRHTLEEYSYLLKYSYILDDVKKLYEEKDKYKGIVKTKFGEIKKSEQKLNGFINQVYLLNKEKNIKQSFVYKLTKSMWASKNKKNKDEIIDRLNMEINNQILETKKLYDELEMDKFDEKLLLFNDNSEIISLFKLSNAYYIYQDKLLEEQDLSINDVINEVNKLILNPYNTLINNIDIKNEKDIKQIISDKYELSSIGIPVSSLESESTIESIINDIDKIMYYNVIRKSNLTVEEIIYVYNIDSILA